MVQKVLQGSMNTGVQDEAVRAERRLQVHCLTQVLCHCDVSRKVMQQKGLQLFQIHLQFPP